MNTKEKFITLNDSRRVHDASLIFGNYSVSMSNFDFGGFGQSQRKTIVSFCAQETYGVALKSRLISSKRMRVDLKSSAEVLIDFSGVKRKVSAELFAKGEYWLCVEIYLDAPLQSLAEVPEHLKPMLQYSEVLNVMIFVVPYGEQEFISSPRINPVYESYGQLGFFLADLDRMDDFVRAKLGGGHIDLKEAFCETELANELFEAGLLILVWGMTPWNYYIYGLKRSSDFLDIPSIEHSQYRGQYKLRSDIKHLSVVPGGFLLNWPACVTMEFPRIILEGDGERVELDVHIRSFDPVGGKFGPPLALVTLYRNHDEPVVNPLLMVDIEAVEAYAGF